MKWTKAFHRFIVFVTTIALVAGFSNLFPPEIGNVPKAHAAVQMLVFWDNGLGSVPTDWTAQSSYNGYMIRGNATAGGTGGSDADHTHTITNTTTGTSAGPVNGRQFKGAVTVADDFHTHDITSSSTDPAGSIPYYRNLMLISYDYGVPPTLPQNAIVIFDTSAPGGFTRYAAQDGAFIRGAATAGGTGGSNALHQHTGVSIGTGSPNQVQTQMVVGTAVYMCSTSHTHSVTGGTTDTDGDRRPPYVDVVLATVDSDATAIPTGMIAMFFNGALGAGWTALSESGGAFYQKYMSGASSYTAGLGSATHTHGKIGGYTFNTWTAATGISSGTPSRAGAGTHSHALTTPTFSTANNAPSYMDVIVAKKAAVYTPASTEWRWYDDEQQADPDNTNGSDTSAGDALANESTAPTSTRIVYSANIIKLRFGVTETAAVAGTDVKFRLQYDTINTFPSATYVGEIASGAIWRYANGVDTDNGAIVTRRLSTTTASGTHNESGTSASTFDPAASTNTEFEFTIQNNGATANITYFFRLYYTENSGGVGTPNGVVSPVVANNYPSFTTAAAYDLELSTAPASVSYGSVTAGTNDKQYIFSAGEKIGFWDKRGVPLATYTVSVSGTNMTNGGNTILNSSITWTSTTTVLTGAFASDKTGMEGQNGATLASTRSAYIADPASEGKGGFYFSPTIDVTDLWNKATGNYAGTITVTLA